MEVSNNQAFNKNFIWTLKGLSSIGEKLGDNPVVFPSAGIRAVLSEVVHFAVDSDKGTVGGFVFAVFWKLFFLVSHCIFLTKKCQMTLFIRNTNCLQIREKSVVTRYRVKAYVTGFSMKLDTLTIL
jgi:hypothetical protein